MIRSLRVRHRTAAWLLLAGIGVVLAAVLVRPRHSAPIPIESASLGRSR